MFSQGEICQENKKVVELNLRKLVLCHVSKTIRSIDRWRDRNPGDYDDGKRQTHECGNVRSGWRRRFVGIVTQFDFADRECDARHECACENPSWNDPRRDLLRKLPAQCSGKSIPDRVHPLHWSR